MDPIGSENNKCSIYGREFSTDENLDIHSLIHDDKPYKCATCGMQFTNSYSLKRHERTHTGEKPYKCVTCGKQFSQSQDLKKHERTHNGEKPYKCATCGMQFTNSSSLKRHERTHTGEKPFKCDICSKAFGCRYVLKNHQKIHEICGETAPRELDQVPMEGQLVPEHDSEQEHRCRKLNEIVSGL